MIGSLQNRELEILVGLHERGGWTGQPLELVRALNATVRLDQGYSPANGDPSRWMFQRAVEIFASLKLKVVLPPLVAAKGRVY